ncbi:MAG: hypothetical protein IKU94_00665 [Bacteroidaceae bacterium]|nr:hypothetical protein [Bacteroidaceae bacterium]MBR4930451.1 hypothetical protein [Bacteroidaceae bacterium]
MLIPKTRKEIYQSYLAGYTDLVLPKPVTRDEIILYNACINGAGVPPAGGGEMVVTFTTGSEGVVVADKTWQDVYDAYFVDGKQVSGVWTNGKNDHSICQLTGINIADAIFVVNTSNENEMGFIRFCLSRSVSGVKHTVFVLTPAT